MSSTEIPVHDGNPAVAAAEQKEKKEKKVKQPKEKKPQQAPKPKQQQQVATKQADAKEIGITALKETNFSEWYTEVVTKCELVEYYTEVC